jgi:hypothetical protein
MLENGDAGGGGWQAGGSNYNCAGCGKAFAQLNSLMQHQDAKQSCRDAASDQGGFGGGGYAQLGYHDDEPQPRYSSDSYSSDGHY